MRPSWPRQDSWLSNQFYVRLRHTKQGCLESLGTSTRWLSTMADGGGVPHDGVPPRWLRKAVPANSRAWSDKQRTALYSRWGEVWPTKDNLLSKIRLRHMAPEPRRKSNVLTNPHKALNCRSMSLIVCFSQLMKPQFGFSFLATKSCFAIWLKVHTMNCCKFTPDHTNANEWQQSHSP